MHYPNYKLHRRKIIKEGEADDNETEDDDCPSNFKNYVVRSKEAISNIETLKHSIYPIKIVYLKHFKKASSAITIR